jgi:MarR family transcriptional regulator, organic hydroperoxide resistance regulator
MAIGNEKIQQLSKEELISRVLELFKTLAQSRMHYQHEPWRKLDVPLAQLKSMFLIHIKGSINVRELALELRVTPGNVTSIIDRLVVQGLVERREGPEDRRIVLLRLTDKGRETINKIQETGDNHMKRFLEKMSARDISALLQGMAAFLKAMKLDWEESKQNNDANFCHADTPSSQTVQPHYHHLMNLI